MSEPVAATIEIIESRNSPLGEGPIVPNDIRINGQSLLASADHPVTVNSIELGGDGYPSLVYVTLTLLARRVIIDTEDE